MSSLQSSGGIMQQQSQSIANVHLMETGEDVLSRGPKWWPAPNSRAKPIPAYQELPFIGERFKLKEAARVGESETPRHLESSII